MKSDFKNMYVQVYQKFPGHTEIPFEGQIIEELFNRWKLKAVVTKHVLFVNKACCSSVPYIKRSRKESKLEKELNGS